MILKKGLLTELEKKKISRKAMKFLGRACFGWVGRSKENQHYFKVGPVYTDIKESKAIFNLMWNISS